MFVQIHQIFMMAVILRIQEETFLETVAKIQHNTFLAVRGIGTQYVRHCGQKYSAQNHC